MFLVIHLFWIIILLERITIMFLVFFTLNYDNKNKFVIFLIPIISIINVYASINWIFDDIKYRSSDSYNASKKIGAIPDNSIILFVNSSRHPAFMAYLKDDVDYYNLNTLRYERYITWNKIGNRTIEINELKKAIDKFSKKYDNIYLIRAISWDYCPDDKEIGDITFARLLYENKIEHIYTTSGNKRGSEIFYIYKYING